MARPRGAKLKEGRLSDGSIVFSAELTVAVGDRRHVTLGYSRDGMDRAAAQKMLAAEQAKIALGQWTDLRPIEPSGGAVTFQIYASDWFAVKRGELAPNSVKDYKWRLTKHLLPFFGPYPLNAIDKKLLKGYRKFKLAERTRLAERIQNGERPVDVWGNPLRPLSNTSINRQLELAGAILAEAEEDELIEEAPTLRKRLKETPPHRTWLMPDELLDLIEAAERVDQRHTPETLERAREAQAVLASGGTLEQAARKVGRANSTTKRLVSIDLEHRDPSPRRAIIATLGLAGPRASELCGFDLDDVDLANRRLTIAGTKTAAAERKIKVVDFLREELLRYKIDCVPANASGPLYPTRTGKRRTKENLLQRVLPTVVREANRVRRQRGVPPINEAITPHTLRRTYISLLLAHGRPVPFVQRQAGHKDPRTTLMIYTEVIDTDFGPTAEILELLCRYSAEGEPAADRASGFGDGVQPAPQSDAASAGRFRAALAQRGPGGRSPDGRGVGSGDGGRRAA
jgi:integrase